MSYFDPILRDANARLSRDLREAGRSTWSADIGDRKLDVLDLQIRHQHPGTVLAETFGTEDTLVRDRVYAVDGRRICWARSFFPANLVAGTRIEQDDTGPGGVPARLAELGHELVAFVEDVEFLAPDRVDWEERERLGVNDKTALVWILRKNITAVGRLVEVTDMRLVASACRFRWAWGL